MTNATLGGLIKDYRIRKRISQEQVSQKMGWADSSRLSKIEQGRAPKLKRETLDKLFSALGLEEYERGDFLYTGGYLPTDEEIQKVLEQVKNKIDTWPYPAYLMDFSWRLLFCNIPNLLAINFGEDALEFVNTTKTNILEYAVMPSDQFPSTVEKGDSPNSLKPFAIAQIASFKTENYRFQNEDWYKKLVKKLMKYKTFKELWPLISQRDYMKELQDYEFKRTTFFKGGQKIVLNFHMYTSRLISNPQLQIVLYHPADEFTRNYFKNT